LFLVSRGGPGGRARSRTHAHNPAASALLLRRFEAGEQRLAAKRARLAALEGAAATGAADGLAGGAAGGAAGAGAGLLREAKAELDALVADGRCEGVVAAVGKPLLDEMKAAARRALDALGRERDSLRASIR
jgi:hypothetical protein